MTTGTQSPTAGAADTEFEEAVRQTEQRRRRARRRDVCLGIGFPIVLLLVWQVAADTHLIDQKIYTAPTKIVSDAVDQIRNHTLLTDLWATTYRLILGYVFGSIAGVIVGVLMGSVRAVRAALEPTLSALYALPKIAILPLLLLIFGISDLPRILLTAIGVFFVLQINTLQGIIYTDARYLEAADAFGARGWRRLVRIVIPAALPQIFTGLRVAAGMAVIIVTAIEFVAANNGLGYLIWNSWQIFQPATMFVGMATVSILGAVLTGVVALVERFAMPWRRDRS
ncbi:ABC transporter permease [Rudaeicoccus suwonensis]|uniref:NitT/TauT family transport system permease protein/sulfonate transport system permease protein n=1 Tax=Rudaeicoccus suwonensis TaxID=657409 RepID=A0A561E1C5_9MICO|nr:ABC transporter permease [Rudaeicoccus suwonensis]TWE09413.1 NitT/TauT family transport system permease protein/sulfonate transport system permease protein [Rudaeicoccus suwonensis]